MTSADATVVDDPDAGRFEVVVGEDVAGFARYRRSDGAVAFTHTEIDPAFESRGLGSLLARRALDAVRAAGHPVLPYCPFIRDYIARHPAYLDLVPADRRGEFDLAPSADRG
jgi:uncharacterized protein